ncbi:MAG: DUF5723 family protein, partial [Bacteroidia bacterium]
VGLKRNALDHSGHLVRDGVQDLKNQGKTDYTQKVYFPAFSDPQFQQNYLSQINNTHNKAVYLGTRVAGPGFLINLGTKNAIGFSTSLRTYLNVDGVSADMANLAYHDFGAGSFNKPNYINTQDILNKQLTMDHMRVTAMSWMEYGITFAHVFKDDNEHYFKAGGTLKLLQGLASAYVNVKNLDFKFDSSQVVKDQSLTITNTQVNYAHSNNLEFPGGSAQDPKQNPITGQPTIKYTLNGYPKFASSPGLGLDLGFVYEWRPDYEKYKYDMDGKTGLWMRNKNKYKLRIGASLTDMGSIKFTKGTYSNNTTIDTTFKFRTLKDTTAYPVSGFDANIKSLAKSQSGPSTYRVSLPMALSFQIDYNIYKDFYINLTPYIAFQFKNKDAVVHDWTNISLAPRWDHKWFGISVPVSYNTFGAQYNQPMRYGLMLRVGPIVVGTNNLGTYVSHKSDIYGADLYAMVKFPIIYRAPKDKDKDKVSDKKDKCPTVPGVWEFMGCPDRDGDHIQDSEDKCPDVAGTKEMQGCPDRDGDKIIDMNDSCPDIAGLAEFNGCPDRDGDKIIDKNDSCPDIAGLVEFNGCPDKDGDGTPDKTDVCPDIPGPKEYKGCPDKDGDTVLDKDDKCPDVAGPVENKGCPWPDTDKDGIVDKDDACPTVAGVKEYKGCPPPPPMKAAEAKILERAFKSLEFATAKDIIKPKSFPSLNDLAKLLKQHEKDWTLKLSGHTDNDGTPEKNMILSEKRAKAVKAYLVKKGANGDKIITEWFGQTQPIADNKTPAGKQKNRRVEMKILFKEEPAK